MLLIELLIDFFFLADIALNFNTGYIAEQVCHRLIANKTCGIQPCIW